MELERNFQAITAQGYGLCSVSYDPVGILRDFAQRRGITFPMLADPDSSIIRDFRVFNEQVQPTSRDYGMPHPGIFLVDADGVVRERFFEDTYWHRMTVPAVFWRLGIDMAATTGAEQREHVRVRTGASDAAVYPGNRLTLFVDVEPLSGVHVYAPEVGASYQGLEIAIDPLPHVQLHAPEYPPASRLSLRWTEEVLTGYERPLRVSIDLSLGTRQELVPVYEAGQGLRITGTLRLQACDDRVCWPREEIPMEWRLALVPPDLERVPEALQHRPKAGGSA